MSETTATAFHADTQTSNTFFYSDANYEKHIQNLSTLHKLAQAASAREVDMIRATQDQVDQIKAKHEALKAKLTERYLKMHKKGLKDAMTLRANADAMEQKQLASLDKQNEASVRKLELDTEEKLEKTKKALERDIWLAESVFENDAERFEEVERNEKRDLANWEKAFEDLYKAGVKTAERAPTYKADALGEASDNEAAEDISNESINTIFDEAEAMVPKTRCSRISRLVARCFTDGDRLCCGIGCRRRYLCRCCFWRRSRCGDCRWCRRCGRSCRLYFGDHGW